MRRNKQCKTTTKKKDIDNEEKIKEIIDKEGKSKKSCDDNTAKPYKTVKNDEKKKEIMR